MMNGGDSTMALEQALAMSRELLAVAELGDAAAAVNLDAARLELLKSARESVQMTNVNDRALLQEITQLNDEAIDHLEHHRRRQARDMDTVSAGKRAHIAYSSTQALR
jgi:hypothetical protein